MAEGCGDEQMYVEEDDRTFVCQQEKDDEDYTPPAVFLCCQCKLPLGDSFSRMRSEDEVGLILLKKTTNNVVAGNETCLSTQNDEHSCLFLTLSCGGCSLELGRLYTCTPKHLDYKRDVFCLNVKSVESYVLGFTPQTVLPDEDDKPESRVCVEAEMEKIKAVVVTMEKRLSTLESKVPTHRK
ncbi:protein Mis18-alpha-like [Huso huso]|uniref:Protein Mis18-alpha n=1 Tax=Huso huso TaxID=61971 RepID=A0ABR0ZPF5_HUSHU